MLDEGKRERRRFAIGFLIHRFSLDYREVCLNDGVRGTSAISSRDKRNPAKTCKAIRGDKDWRYSKSEGAETRRKEEPKVSEGNRRKDENANGDSLE